MKENNIASHYIGEKGKDYLYNETLNHLGYQLQKKFYIPYLNKKMNVLDFGCGTGSLIVALQPYVGSIEGLEINENPRSIATIQQNLIVHESLETLPDSKKYDVIISNHVLEHIPNVVDTLKKLHNHLVPGGIFITVLPIDDFRSSENSHWNSNDKDHHLHTWTPLLFGNTLDEAGFLPKQLKVITSAWSPKFFFLGDTWMQSIINYLLSVFLKKRQLLAVGIRKE